jgi:adenine-specific DNA-methyltransferase
MSNKQKLELTWIGKNNPEYDIANIESRILEERTDLSYGDKESENIIIHGDNLLALKALLPEYEGKVKCIYIDPPYNTGNAFEHYDDSVEHSTWLSLMRPRLELLKSLLSKDGVIWISIDDQEAHYLKVLCDEIFFRSNFLADITYERSGSAGLGQGGLFVNTSERILAYKNDILNTNEVLGSTELELKTMKRYNKVLVSEGTRELVEEFNSVSNDLPIQIYKHTNFVIETISLKSPQARMPEIQAEFVSNFGKLFRTNNVQKENEFQNNLLKKMDKKFLYTVDYTPSRGKNLNKKTTLYYYNAELFAWLKDTAFIANNKIQKTNKLTTVWKHEDIPKADLANEGEVEFPRSKKPEQLIKRMLEISSNAGDFVLDSFLGSGTTAAVAHKMGRKYIGIEMGEHAYTHCKVRLDKVIDGTDQGGISKAVEWKGGGGFKFYELAPSFVAIDEFGNPVIDNYYNDTKLIRAMCKLTNYTFAPSPSDYWKQGKGQGNNSIYVTTQMLSVAMVQQIASHLGTNETLLICPKKFEPGCKEVDSRITIKKIPQSILKACQFGKKEYLLPIKESAMEEVDEEESDSDDN